MIKIIKAGMICMVIASMIGCGGGKYEYQEQNAQHEPMPFKDASMCAGMVEVDRVFMAAEISDKDLQDLLFSFRFESLGYIPVKVTVTNHSPSPVLILGTECTVEMSDMNVEPSNVYTVSKKAEGIVRGSEIFAYFSMPATYFIATGRIINNLQTIDEAKVSNIYARSFKEKVLPPGQTTIGYVFFDEKGVPEGDKFLQLKIQKFPSINYIDLKAKIQ